MQLAGRKTFIYSTAANGINLKTLAKFEKKCKIKVDSGFFKPKYKKPGEKQCTKMKS